jgi:hypothetical protein
MNHGLLQTNLAGRGWPGSRRYYRPDGSENRYGEYGDEISHADLQIQVPPP